MKFQVYQPSRAIALSGHDAEVTINRSVVEGKKPPLLRRKQDKDAA